MGLGISIGGSKSKSKTQSSSSSTSKGTSILEGMDAAAKAQLDDFLGTLMGRVAGPNAEDPRYSKEAAITDSKGMVAAIFDEFSKTSLPKIFSQQGKAGAYNNAGSQLMADNAFAEANTQAAGVVMDTILNYAKLSQSKQDAEQEALLNVFGLQNKAYNKETTKQSTSTTGESFTTGSGMTAGASFTAR